VIKRITKAEWTAKGGLRNGKLFTKQGRDGRRTYWESI
jgi:hypothetical protein